MGQQRAFEDGERMGVAPAHVEPRLRPPSLLDIKDKAAAGTEHPRDPCSERRQVPEVNEDIGGDDDIAAARRAGKVFKYLCLDQFVVNAFFGGERQHARGQIDSHQPPRVGAEQGPALTAPAAKVEHVEAAVFDTTVGAQELEQGLGGTVAKAPHIGIVAPGIAVENVKYHVVWQTLRHRSLAQRHQAHGCDRIVRSNR